MRPEENEKSGLLLALETSGDVCGVTSLRDGKLATEHTFRHNMHLSERLPAHIESVLSEAGTKLADVNAFAVGIGPGSFTGTRIGVMTAKTLAAVERKPLYGIGGLDAIAFEYAGLRDVLAVPILPCRTGAVYAGAFFTENHIPEMRLEPGAFALADLTEKLAQQPIRHVLLCGASVPKHGDELRGLLESAGLTVSVGTSDWPRSLAVAHLAYHRFGSGDLGDDPFALVPLYISPPPITLPKTPIPQG